MEIKLTPVKLFEVEIEGQPVGVFAIDSEWNGLTCLKTEDGDKIVAGLSPPEIFKFLDPENKSRSGSVVTASPSILAKVTIEKGKE